MAVEKEQVAHTTCLQAEEPARQVLFVLSFIFDNG